MSTGVMADRVTQAWPRPYACCRSLLLPVQFPWSGRNTGECLGCAGFTVREAVAADHDCKSSVLDASPGGSTYGATPGCCGPKLAPLPPASKLSRCSEYVLTNIQQYG